MRILFGFTVVRSNRLTFFPAALSFLSTELSVSRPVRQSMLRGLHCRADGRSGKQNGTSVLFFCQIKLPALMAARLEMT